VTAKSAAATVTNKTASSNLQEEKKRMPFFGLFFLVFLGNSRMRLCKYSGAFLFSPSFHGHGAHVSHAAQAQDNFHYRFVAGDFHEHDKIKLAKRVVQRHLSTGLLNHTMGCFYSLGSRLNVANALLSPFSKDNKTVQNITCKENSEPASIKIFTPAASLHPKE
jgi:hypothetical protein